MNTKITMPVTLALFSLLTLYSCSEDSTNESEIKAKSISSPYNVYNEFDEVGIIHNQVLEEVVANRNNLTTVEDYIEYADEVFHTQQDPNYNYETLNIEATKDVLADSLSFYSNIIDESALSSVAKNKVHLLFDDLSSHLYDNELSYNTIYDKIISFEESINNSNLSTNDKYDILKVSSVARHSTYFWYNQFEHENSTVINSKKRSFWRWLAVGIADAAGGVAGAIVGQGVVSIASSIAGAVGASAGAVALINWISPEGE